MDPVFVVIILVIACVVGGLVALGWWLDKKRREALLAVAGQLGMQFAADGGGALGDDLGALPLFNRGHSRKAANALLGQIEDVQARIFDYRYTTGSGKNQSTHGQTVAAFGLGDAPLPVFTLGPESVFHFLAELVGQGDIDFDTHPQFSRRYLLRGPDEAAIRAFFDEKVLSFFEANPGWSVEAAGRWLLVYRPGRAVKPRDVPAFLEQSFAIFGVFGQA